MRPLFIVDAAGVAALYGSVSSVTFLVARAYAEAAGFPMEGYVTGLVALMELGILVALFYGRIALSRADGKTGVALGAILLETLRGRGLLLLGGGLVIGAASGEANFAKIEPFFVDLFRGVLVLFLLEMGMTAGRQLKDFARVGGRMLAFGLGLPMVNGFVVSGLATAAGLPMGSAFALGTVAASASYIDAPAAVRATFPDANPSVYLTTSLGITFPFMLLAGVPLVWQMTAFWQGFRLCRRFLRPLFASGRCLVQIFGSKHANNVSFVELITFAVWRALTMGRATTPARSPCKRRD